MRISRIQNNNQPSFQGWSSASKGKLAQVVAKLPKVQIETQDSKYIQNGLLIIQKGKDILL